MIGSKPYKFSGFGDNYGPKPYKFIGFGDSYGPKPYKFIGFGRGSGNKVYYQKINQKLSPGAPVGLDTGARLRRTPVLRPAGAPGPNCWLSFG